MIITIHGEDTFRSNIKIKELEKAYQEKYPRGFSFEKFYADEINFQEFKSIVQSQSLFDTNKFLILKNLSKNPNLKKEIGEWKELGGLSKDRNILIMLHEVTSILKDKEYKKILKISSKSQEFKKLYPIQATSWFSNYFSQSKINISQPIISKVVNLCNVDMWQIYSELKKAYIYKNGEKITKEDLDFLHIGTQESQIFPTIDAIFSKNKDKAIYNLLLQWNSGESPEYIFYMLERQLKLVALVKEKHEKETSYTTNDIAKALGLHPFVVKKTLPLADKFSWQKIKNLYARVESLDLKSKTGQLNPYLSCELLSVAILA